MSQLQRALDERRTAQAVPGDYEIHATGTATTLTLHQTSGEVWVFLWAGLVSAWCDLTEEREKILFTFWQHTVAVEGQNLDRIITEVGEMRLKALREQIRDSACPKRSQTGETAVCKITVKAVNEQIS